MQKTKLFIGIFLLTALLLAACSGGQTANNVMDDMSNDSAQSDNMMNDDHGNDMANDSMDDSMDDTNDDMMDNDDDDMMDDNHEDMSDDMSDDGMDSDMVSPDLFGYEFEDVVTGEKFSISQFKGKVVLVENYGYLVLQLPQAAETGQGLPPDCLASVMILCMIASVWNWIWTRSVWGCT